MGSPLDLTPPTGDRLAHVRAATDWAANAPRDPATGRLLVTLAAWLGHNAADLNPCGDGLGRLWANHGVHLDADT